MNSVIGIIGSSPGYSRRLADAINSRKDVGYTAVAFKDIEELSQFLKTRNLSVLLSDQEEHSDLLSKPTAFCLLTNEPDEETGRTSIFKFQAASAIIKSILLLNPETTGGINHVFTVFSPSSAEKADAYAEKLATKLALEGRTLFLSWEYFGGKGREEQEHCGKTVSDLLFTARKNEAGMKRLMTGLEKRNGYEYFCGTEYYADLWQYSPEEMERLVEMCKKHGNYEYVVFCCGFFSEGVEALMGKSDEVMLVRSTEEKRDVRIEDFLRQMKYSGKHGILSKIKEVTV